MNIRQFIIFSDIPTATISKESNVFFGFETQIRATVSSTLPLNTYKWQKSVDGTAFHFIDINAGKYHGSDYLKDTSLVLQKPTFDDMLYYCLLVGNLIGDRVSNTVYLDVTGSMFTHVKEPLNF